MLKLIRYMYRNMLHKLRNRAMRGCWVNFQYRGVLLIWIIVEKGATPLAVGARGGGGDCLDIFSSSIFPLFFLLLPGRRSYID